MWRSSEADVKFGIRLHELGMAEQTPSLAAPRASAAAAATGKPKLPLIGNLKIVLTKPTVSGCARRVLAERNDKNGGIQEAPSQESTHQHPSAETSFPMIREIENKENVDPGKDHGSKESISVLELKAELQDSVVNLENAESKQNAPEGTQQRCKEMPLSSLKQIIGGKRSQAMTKSYPDDALETLLPMQRLKLQPLHTNDKECDSVVKVVISKKMYTVNLRRHAVEPQRNKRQPLDDDVFISKVGNCQTESSNMSDTEIAAAVPVTIEKPKPVIGNSSMAPSEDLLTPWDASICRHSKPTVNEDLPIPNRGQDGNCQTESSYMCFDTEKVAAIPGTFEKPRSTIEAMSIIASQDLLTPLDSLAIGGSFCLEDEAKSVISLSGPVAHSDAPISFQCHIAKSNVESQIPSHGDAFSEKCKIAASSEAYLRLSSELSDMPKATGSSMGLEDKAKCVTSISGAKSHSNASSITDSKAMNCQVPCHSNAPRLHCETYRCLGTSELHLQAQSVLDPSPFPKAVSNSSSLEDDGRCILSLSGPPRDLDAPTGVLNQNENVATKPFQMPSSSNNNKPSIKNLSYLTSFEVHPLAPPLEFSESSMPKSVGQRVLSEACFSADDGLSKDGSHFGITSVPDKNHSTVDVRSRQRKKRWENEHFFWVNGKRYQKLGKIGTGGSSEVYKIIASDCTIYALKRIKLKGRDYGSACGFYQEIEYLERLRGKKYIIQLIDYEVTEKGFFQEKSKKVGTIQDDIFIYMVLEYGEIDLAHMLLDEWNERMSSGKEINYNWIRYFWEQILEAVNTIHEERIVHSDLKPANFLLVKGVLKLIDFGIAKAIQSDTTNILRESQVGTLNYMSPESFLMNEDEVGQVIKCGRPSDIWSLGCILYQVVYGKTPFSHITKLWAKVKEITNPNYGIPFPPVSNRQLVDVLKKCLAWKREDRLRIPELLKHPFLQSHPILSPIHKE